MPDLPNSRVPSESPKARCPEALAGVLDWKAAVRRLDGDEDFMHELCKLFLEEAHSMRSRLESAVASEDLAVLLRAAHNLRGAGGTLAATRLTELAESIENLAHEGRSDEAHALAPTMLVEFDRLVAALLLSREDRAAA